jgi:hypothetical protein
MLQMTYAAAYVNYCTLLEDSWLNIISAVILILLFFMFDRVCMLRVNVRQNYILYVNFCSEDALPKTEIPHMMSMSIKDQLLQSHPNYSDI